MDAMESFPLPSAVWMMVKENPLACWLLPTSFQGSDPAVRVYLVIISIPEMVKWKTPCRLRVTEAEMQARRRLEQSIGVCVAFEFTGLGKASLIS